MSGSSVCNADGRQIGSDSKPQSATSGHVHCDNSNTLKSPTHVRFRRMADCLFKVDEDAVQPTTTRKELWSYYLYYNGSSTDVLREGTIRC